MSEQSAKFDMWAVVDVMGHQRYAGKVTEVTIAGQGFIRLDVPSVVTRKNQYAHGGYREEGMKLAPVSKFFSPGAIHSITPCTEEAAHAVAALVAHSPAFEFGLPEPQPALPPADPASVSENESGSQIPWNQW